MSKQHPIIAVTGSSGSGTSTVRHAFHDLFRRLDIKAAWVQGDGFLRYDRQTMRQEIESAAASGRVFSHFSPEANHLDKLDALFRQYSHDGTGSLRNYPHDDTEAAQYGTPQGQFTDWKPLLANTDMLFYEGHHGGTSMPATAHTPAIQIAEHADLLLGVTPSVNLEWIQKIHHDCGRTGCGEKYVIDTILHRMPDYVNHIVPQFARTHINVQRVPLVDTSHPFIARDIPQQDESIVVIHFREPHKFHFPNLLKKLAGAHMTRRNTMLVPGGKMILAIEAICTPLIAEMMAQRNKAD
jgi:phosphoribulokinase